VVVIEHHDAPSAREMAVPVPVYVPVYPVTRRTRQVYPTTQQAPARFIPTTGLGAPPALPTTEIPAHRRSRGKPEPGPRTDPRDRP
jgi:hypothetical protein